MGWKSVFLAFIVFILLNNIVFSQPFGPPVYVANPDSLECKYYFAGDEKHFNPRPENYTISIGYTTDFKDQEQACSLFKCQYTGGRVLLQDKDDPNPNICECPAGSRFNNETGCTFNSKITGFAVKEESSENNFLKIFNLKNLILLLGGILLGFLLGLLLSVKSRKTRPF